MSYLEKHHIVYKSQGGLTFPLNLITLTSEEHRGDNSPHMNKKRDLELKQQLQTSLEKLLCKDYYTTEELIEILELKPKEADKLVKRLWNNGNGYKRMNIIKKLMGDRYFL